MPTKRQLCPVCLKSHSSPGIQRDPACMECREKMGPLEKGHKRERPIYDAERLLRVRLYCERAAAGVPLFTAAPSSVQTL